MEHPDSYFIDCGAIQFTIPYKKSVQLCFEIDTFADHSSSPQYCAVHCQMPGVSGECILSAFAVPRSDDTRADNTWVNILRKTAYNVREQGFSADIYQGIYDYELDMGYGQYAIKIMGYQGDRWVIRAVIFMPNNEQSIMIDWITFARDILANCTVSRGDIPMPAYSYLPLTIPHNI